MRKKLYFGNVLLKRNLYFRFQNFSLFVKVRIVIGCPNINTQLQPMDHIIVLSQWIEDKEKAE